MVVNLSKIIEFKDTIEQDEGAASFVSFESMLPPEERTGSVGEDLPDPIEEARKEQEAIRLETEEMVAKANAEKERIEQEAYDKGFARGEEEGRIAGQKEFDEKIAKALELIGTLTDERGRVGKQYEEDLLTLVKTMVERLVYHEVSVNPLVIQACMRKAMEYVVEDSTVMVHLQADDFQSIKEMSLDDPTLLEGTSKVELIEDPVVSQGGCRLQTDFGEIDATMENCKEKLFEIVDRAFLAALAEG